MSSISDLLTPGWVQLLILNGAGIVFTLLSIGLLYLIMSRGEKNQDKYNISAVPMLIGIIVGIIIVIGVFLLNIYMSWQSFSGDHSIWLTVAYAACALVNLAPVLSGGKDSE